MKKFLTALAMLACAGVASAQSSVTLFGIVDATLALGKGSISNKTQLTHSGYNSSRLGFRGTEDLGGGMSASFWLEAGVSNDNGAGSATNTNNQASGSAPAAAGSQGLTFNRRSTVSLAGGWGELRLGRDYDPTFWNKSQFDPFGANGVGTNQILNSQLTFLYPGNSSSGPVARASNSIGYFLPRNLGGFYGQAMHFRGENSSGTATSQDGTGTGARVGYASGPVNVAVAYQSTTYASGDVREMNVGGFWDFGRAKLMGVYARDRSNGASAVTGTGGLVGALVPVGVGDIRLSYATYKTDRAGEPKTSKLSLGYVHHLSKRTALYGTFARLKNSGGATQSLNGAVTAANQGAAGYDFGLRHSF